ncbi:YktB family protein [Bacillus alkalicellulosilyticus]|uniref:YktB family protein n=1 Tax=Alkalihalobacterium alkalicellulosilyticum TaxID=1912214 RepID=UPI0009963DFA|nr:DUF1054 domain-containing protein [Bacillus alkalicellulosilyticus]
MSFTGFSSEDFNVFSIEGLEARMEGIQTIIQPKFKAIGEELTDDLSMLTGSEMNLHIAKHARRTVNPPKDTWLAFCHDKRGYKKHPHFQIGLFDDHLFIWLAFIYELPNKSEIAQRLLENIDEVRNLIPDDYVISMDHMQKAATPVKSLTTEDLEEKLRRFRDVKKAEFLIGRHFSPQDPTIRDGQQFIQIAKETYATLVPLYKKAFSY